MKVKISNKHQVVIPKEARKTMRLLKGGGYMKITRVTPSEITFKKVAENDSIMRFAGTAKEAWGKDPVGKLRTERDQEWD